MDTQSLTKALQMFDQIPTFRCGLIVKSYNSVLDALFKCSEVEKMREFLVGFGNHVTQMLVRIIFD
ncbi:Pentatricopeptide repeat [Trema orientale]|uniref:Pentatricopeptide repeat n=1 Tax=Trema orientale TaxID=63057 RepID=A0A2P5F670_TREOI|nr:Pentatricopeptide repeat [Trema orientale]